MRPEKLLKALTEDPLRMIAGQHPLVQRYAGETRCDRSLRNSLGSGFILEIVEPRPEAAGAAGRRLRRRDRHRQDCARRERSEKQTRGHRGHLHRNDSPSRVMPGQHEMLGATSTKTRLLTPACSMRQRDENINAGARPRAHRRHGRMAHIVRIARAWRRNQRHTRQAVGQRTTDGLVAMLILGLMRRPCAARETRPPGNPRRSAVPAPDGAAAVAD